MPTIVQRIRASKRLTESDCRMAVVKAIRGAGVYCDPIEDKIRKGIPDVYVDGGIWIECKMHVLVTRGQGRNVLTFFKDHQRVRLMRICRDRNLAAFLFANPRMETAFFICEFRSLYDGDNRLWTFGRAQRWGVPLEAANAYVKRVVLASDRYAQGHLRLLNGFGAAEILGGAADQA